MYTFTFDFQRFMKKGIFLIGIVFLAFCFSCGPKPAYKTTQGKKKQKYYNNLQFGGDPKAVPPPKSKKKN
jgi:hypothetical protein